MPNHRTGLLIIRAWVEDDSAEPLRANIRVIDDISIGIARTLTLAQPHGVTKLVDEWVQGILDATGSDVRP